MKSVLISIRPKWCELIASGKKTIEVRKTRPKINTPFKCYIYQTRKTWLYSIYQRIADAQGKVIGEFVCDEIDCLAHIGALLRNDHLELVHRTNWGSSIISDEWLHQACLTMQELETYSKGNNLYGWHISDLVIYDKPKESNDFAKAHFPTFDEMYDDGSLCQYCPATNFGQVFVNGVPDDFVCDCDCYDAYEEYAAQNRF